MKKKVDPRVKTLIENNIKTRHRSLFVIVGDRGRDQVVNIQFILSKITTKKPSVLWCYKKELGFSSHRKKRMKYIKKKMQRGQYDSQFEDPFELFVSTTNIRYCYYKETQSILGQTFGMCILQDFEALTPNNLCRTIETVEGGGVICLLLNSMDSLKQLYSLTMDMHSRFKTENFQTMEPRFNERFLLSLATCNGCLIMDDELNILPICKIAQSIVPIEDTLQSAQENYLADEDIRVGNGLSIFLSPNQKELNKLKESVKEIPSIGAIVKKTVTCDQARCILSLSDVLQEKKTNSVIAITAARGRGKSAALGLGIATAIAFSYSNIIVTSPNPEMIGTLFLFVKKGLEALGMKEHTDYEAIHSSDPEFSTHKDTITQINIFHTHRQTIRYIDPEDYSTASKAELLVVDEAAAIPLTTVKRMLGSGLIFLSSTVHGYEGTGRSLSLKLINDLKFGNPFNKIDSSSNSNGTTVQISQKSLKEIALKEPIRYNEDDPIEKWLNELLCLNATVPINLSPKTSLVSASKCELYMVNRDALFSYHKSSEKFLHNLMSLFVSSHYKNSPNDLALLSDAPAHQLFVLLPPIDDEATSLPDIFCAIQISVEGNLSKQSIDDALGRGLKPSGDLLAWTLSQHFSDEDFGSLTGIRIVRIACHPHLQRMGYGSEALKQLIKFYESNNDTVLEDNHIQQKISSSPTSSASTKSSETSHLSKPNSLDSTMKDETKKGNLYSEVIEQREVPPLLQPCEDCSSGIGVHYFGTSFGFTAELSKFWSKLGFIPVYLRQTRTETTGEHSAIMIRSSKLALTTIQNPLWVQEFAADFRLRFLQLLGSAFSHFPITLALSVIDPPVSSARIGPMNSTSSNSRALALPILDAQSIKYFFSDHDLKRIKKYAKQLADFHFITDLLPIIGWLVFSRRLADFTLSHIQCAVLLAMACQRKTSEQAASELGVPHNQAMALFYKAMNKFSSHLNNLLEREAEEELIKEGKITNSTSTIGPILTVNGELPSESFIEELNEDAKMVSKDLSKQRQELLESLNDASWKQYSMEGITKDDFENELKGRQAKGNISIARKNFNKTDSKGKPNHNKKTNKKFKHY